MNENVFISGSCLVYKLKFLVLGPSQHVKFNISSSSEKFEAFVTSEAEM